MGLFKRNHVWWMSFTYKGEQIRKSTEVTSKAVAEKIYFKAMTQVAERKWLKILPGEEKTFRDLMERYLSEYSSMNKAQTSHKRDKSLIAHLNKFFGDMTLTEIAPNQISNYKTLRRTEGASPRTINYELTTMGHAFNLGIKEWEWVRENPVSKVSKEKVNNQIERWLTFEEEENLLANSPEWLKEIITFALNTGFRQSEIINLQWHQVDLFRRTITILDQKNKAKDTLPVNQKTLEVLRGRAKVRHINTNLVFYSEAGTCLSARNLLRSFYSVIKKAGLTGLRFHDLRHSWASRLVQHGVDIYAVQKLGRWKTISMVLRYAHHYSESLRPGIDTLDKIYHNFITIKENEAVKKIC
jgi:integrase